MNNTFLLLYFICSSICFSQKSYTSIDISNAALELTNQDVTYDPSYFSISYPNGDVPKDKGVCTDVVIRTYHKIGIDLQKNVHEDMKANFNLYPKI